LIEGIDMYSTPILATRFARNARVLRAEMPLSEDQMRKAAPSVFAAGKHSSRSDRYTYIPTIEVLRGLRKEGFEPFMVAQGQSRVEGSRIHQAHDSHAPCSGWLGSSRHQAGGERNRSDQQPRRGQLVPDARRRVPLRLLQWPGRGQRIQRHSHPHEENIEGEVIEGAFRVLDDFEIVDASTKA
jgi:hypothetical protein